MKQMNNGSKCKVAIHYVMMLMLSMAPCASFTVVAQTTPSEMINKDVTSQDKSTDANAKKMEILKRTIVEDVQNRGINGNLYQQGLPTSMPATDPKLFDPNFIVHNHYDGTQNSLGTQYCDQKAMNEGGNGFTCQQDPLMAHSDLKASTLLTSPVIDETRLGGITAFIQNLIEPAPNPLLQNPATVRKNVYDPNEIQKVGKALAVQTTLSVARQPFAEMVGKRTPEPNSKQSMMQRMQREANQRFLNSEWYNTLKKSYEAAIAANPSLAPALLPINEMAMTMAYMAWMEQQRYEQGERIEALLAAMLVQLNQSQQTGVSVTEQTQSIKVTPSGEVQTPQR